MTKKRIALLLVTVVCLSAALLLAACTKNVENPKALLQEQIATSVSADTYYVKYSTTVNASLKIIEALNVHTVDGVVTAHRQQERQETISSKYENAYFGIPKGSNDAIYTDYSGNQTAIGAAEFFALDNVAPYTVTAVLEGLQSLTENDYEITATQKGRVHIYVLKLKDGVSNPYLESGNNTLYVEATNGKISKIADHETSPNFAVYITYQGPNVTLPALKK